MTEKDIIDSPLLGQVVLNLLTVDLEFKKAFKSSASSIASDIESASTNPNCTCKTKVSSYVIMNASSVGSLLYDYGVKNNSLANIKNLFDDATLPVGPSASGRVAKTSIKEWPDFAKGVEQAGLTFKHMSTSIVGEDVYVFFL